MSPAKGHLGERAVMKRLLIPRGEDADTRGWSARFWPRPRCWGLTHGPQPRCSSASLVAMDTPPPLHLQAPSGREAETVASRKSPGSKV